MKQSGYSGTPLFKKLGIKEGFKVSTYNAPKDYAIHLEPLPDHVTISDQLKSNSDLIHAFCHSMEELVGIYPDLKKNIHKAGMVWIAWPKGSSKVPTDINRDIIRDYVLDNGLVDVKVASYNDIYSSLKFVYRLKDR